MNKYLIDHRVKKFLRSPTFDQSVLTAIWVGLVALYLVVVIGVMGMFLPEILQGVAGDAEQVGPILSRVIIYYMIFDLVIRYFFQKLPGMDAKHYILLPIRKTRLVRFLLNISVFNLFNFFGLLLVLPFFYRVIRSENELWSSIAWLLGMLSIIAINHFTAILIKRWGTLNFRPVLITAALIALLLSLEYFGWISIMSLSASIFTTLLHSSVGFAVLVLATIGLYWWNTKLMLYFIYEDRGQVKTGSSVGKNRLAFLVNRGITGTLVLNEIRLILRNKRAKSVFLGSLLIPVAFLVYFSPETSEVILVFLPFAIIAIGAFAMQYGQLMTSWESSFFDGLMTQRLSTVDYYQSKWYLLSAIGIILYLILLPFSLFVENLFGMLTVSLFINLGFVNFAILFLAAFNKKSIDLSRSAMWNHQGMSLIHYIIPIPIISLPVLLYLPFWLLDYSQWGLIFIGLLSIISLMLKRFWLKGITALHQKRKYKKLSSFRKK